jgi:RNA polymerase sigma factor (TIGR02999 family)
LNYIQSDWRCFIRQQDDLTRLLLAWGEGDQDALEKLTPLVHEELYRLARMYMARERMGHTLQTTALVNEAYLRLIEGRRVKVRDRAHFFALSAKLMRRILVDFARSRRSQKRGGAVHPVPLDESVLVVPQRSADLIALDEVLEKLAVFDERKAEIVELRFFGGLTAEETADALNMTAKGVYQEFELAKMWLRRELNRETGR